MAQKFYKSNKNRHKQSHKTGNPPGTLVHIGKPKQKNTVITLIDFNQDKYEERELHTTEEMQPYANSNTTTWINIDGLHDTNLISAIGQVFGLHPLLLEDIVNTNQRAKSEKFKEYVFFVIKMLTYNEQTKQIEVEQISFVVGQNYILSFQEEAGDLFDELREFIRTSKGIIRSQQNDYLIYRLIDVIVDHYFVILDQIEEDLIWVENCVAEGKFQLARTKMQRLKRELLVIHKSVMPLREAIENLKHTGSQLISNECVEYLRDVSDHTNNIIDDINLYRNMLSDLNDEYHAAQGARLNEVIKVLTIVSTIFIPLTFIAGVYGMNFKNMPETENPNGYFITLGVMLGIGLLFAGFFRFKKWW